MSLLERARRAATVLDLAGAALFVLALLATFATLGRPVGPYDEGIILTDAKMIGWGFVPYRDFYSNYPPGVFLVVLALWKLFGASVLSVRLLGIAVHIVVALLCGRLAGRLAGRRFSLLGAAVVLAWLVRLPAGMSAWLSALACLLAAIEIGAGRPAPGPGRSLAAGVALGLVADFRHDLFCYAVAALAVVFAAAYFLRRTRADLRWRWLLAGVAVPLALLWIPTFGGAGIRQVVADLYLDQVRYVLPARETPWPRFFTQHHGVFPAFIGQAFPAAAFLTIIGPFLAFFFVARRSPDVAALAVAAISLAVLPQAAGRTDLTHVLYTVGPALILAAAGVELLGGRAWSWRLVAAAAVVAYLVAPIDVLVWPPPRLPSFREPPLAGARRPLVEYIRSHTQPGEPVYVGYRQHRQIIINEMDLYYYFDRPGATRYMQFDPNVVTRADVQTEMARELEAKQVQYVVLAMQGGFWVEPNLSSRAGADVLDDYLKKSYEKVATFGPYEVHRRAR